jgi:hypothetical protein
MTVLSDAEAHGWIAGAPLAGFTAPARASLAGMLDEDFEIAALALFRDLRVEALVAQETK